MSMPLVVNCCFTLFSTMFTVIKFVRSLKSIRIHVPGIVLIDCFGSKVRAHLYPCHKWPGIDYCCFTMFAEWLTR